MSVRKCISYKIPGELIKNILNLRMGFHLRAVEYHLVGIYNADAMEHNTREYMNRLGWEPFFEEQYEFQKVPGSIPARVSSESKGLYRVFSPNGELAAKLSGKMRFTSRETNVHPAVGDWVVLKPLAGEENGVIHSILPRKSKFSRKAAGRRVCLQLA